MVFVMPMLLRRVAASLRWSNKLKTLATTTIFQPKVFDVTACLEQILAVKKIPQVATLVRTNIEQSLVAINYANAVIARAQALKATAYDPKDNDHEVSQ